VAANAGEGAEQLARVRDLEAEREGEEEVPEDVQDGRVGLGQIVGIRIGDALAVAGDAARGGADEEKLLVGRAAEGGLEGPAQRQPEVPDLYPLEFQRRASARDARAVQLRQEP
jgi:hypothetical protein